VDLSQSAGAVLRHTPQVDDRFFTGGEVHSEKLTKLRNSLKSWDKTEPKYMEMFFHYTSYVSATRIITSGFRPSSIGMSGEGVYLATQSPAESIGRASWPSAQFRENLLKANYGADWNSDGRWQAVDVVIVLFVDESVQKLVEDREDARMVEPRHIENDKVFVVKQAIQLYDSAAAPVSSSSLGAERMADLSQSAGPVLQSQLGAMSLGLGRQRSIAEYPNQRLDRYTAQPFFHQIDTTFAGLQLIREEPYIFLVPDLFSAAECDQLIVKLASAEVQQSSGNAQHVATGARTSMTAFARNDELPELRQRLAKLANVAVEQLQPTKLTHYDKGQRFATHTDAMVPPEDWGAPYKQVWDAPARYPNRMVTIFVYLNDCERGGRTCWRSFDSPDLYSDRFPKLAERLGVAVAPDMPPVNPNQLRGVCVTPRRGLAVVHFPCTTLEMAGMPDTNAVHEAEEAVDRKFILQQFIWSAAVDPGNEALDEKVRDALQRRLEEQPQKPLSTAVL